MKPYHHLTYFHRICLQILLESKAFSIRTIALFMQCSPSTISREINRNKNKDGTYNAWRAQNLTVIRHKKCRPTLKVVNDPELKEYIIARLKEFWTPEQIAHKWDELHTDKPICFDTIYRNLKAKALLPCTAKKHLRRHNKRRGHRHDCDTIKPEHTIHERPLITEIRGRIGDWEGDTIYGGIGKGALVTAIDRRTHLLMAKRIIHRTKEETRDAMVAMLRGQIVKSITLDNGSEFAAFKEIGRRLNAIIYFADPHSPWQKGSIENANDLLRFFFPRGTDFRKVTDDEVQQAVDYINNRPRKGMDWMTPIEFVEEMLH